LEPSFPQLRYYQTLTGPYDQHRRPNLT
jgi:hypothetical protein